MEMREYEELITMLDHRIQQTRKERLQAQNAKKRLEKVRHYMQGIEGKVRELTELRVSVPSQAMEQLVLLKKEERELLDRLEKLPREEKENGELVLCDEDKGELLELMRNVEQIELETLSQEERWAIFRIWAARWRILVERIGQDTANADSRVRRVYGRIMESMNRYPGPESRFFPALNRGRDEDWEKECRLAEQECEAVSRRMTGRRDAEKALAALKQELPESSFSLDDEALRLFRHKVRMIASEVSLRGDLADLLYESQVREALGDEFEFLWKSGEEEEVHKGTKNLSRSQILQRLLRRMVSNTLIGGCHGPLERICTGFPDHQRGTAKDAVVVLVSCGIVRLKSSPYGDRVSIEPSALSGVKEFLESEPLKLSLLGAGEVAAWAQR